MKSGYSIRARLVLGAAIVLVAFMAGAGIAVQRAHADSVLDAHFSRLQATVYLLLARAELKADGTLDMPADLAEPRLAVPASGLYAGIYNVQRNEEWRSTSAIGVQPPLGRVGVAPGEWRNEEAQSGGRRYLAVRFGVKWDVGRQSVPLVLSVAEDRAEFDREVATFSRTLWMWLGGAGLLLLLAQVALLEWGLAPLKRVSAEMARIEAGAQSRIEGSYPNELSGVTDSLNALVQQERVRQRRYKEALSFLAHSLKTPLAVLRGALHEPQRLPAAVEHEVARMDEIVQHQLGRAGAGGASRFAAPVAIAPVLARVRDALAKVHAEKNLEFRIDCGARLKWRVDEGDLFEILGNLMDNAAKWAKHTVAVTARGERSRLVLRVEDDGPGFSDTESVLKMHVRLDERVPGHGVGLAIVKEMVESHEGELTLGRSEALGGASVEVVLPLA